MHQLHWLPVRQRIVYKILLLTFKALSDTAPAYITELVSHYKPPRSLRSASQYLLIEPSMNMSTYGSRSFSVSAPRLWNKLPLAIKNSETIGAFKTRLKTHLFKIAYQ